MRVIIQERLDHDIDRYTECNNKEVSTAKAEAIHDNYVKRRHRRLKSEYSQQYFDAIKKQREYKQEVAMKEQEYIEFVDVHNRRTKVYLSPEHISTIEFLRETGNYHDLYKYVESLDKKQEMKIDKDMLGVLQRHKQVCTTCNEYVAMINPQQSTVDKVIQKALDIGLVDKTQKASTPQQENTPMTDKLTELRKNLLAYQGALRI